MLKVKKADSLFGSFLTKKSLGYSIQWFLAKTPRGWVFFFYASLKLKTQIVEISLNRLLIKKVAKTKFQAKTCENPQGVGFLFLLVSLKKTEKKPHPPGGFLEKPLLSPSRMHRL